MSADVGAGRTSRGHARITRARASGFRRQLAGALTGQSGPAIERIMHRAFWTLPLHGTADVIALASRAGAAPTIVAD
ncbi:MAG: hypothetical protein HOW73_39640 [Polyangiaceae bacterium]|nr:hypothetical protein [Polyangiaceae bacterium]